MRVLLVEDNGPIARSIQTALKAENMVIDTTDMGEDALEIAKLYDYDIILLDLSLPDMDGAEVLRRLRQARVTTPVLVLSTQSQPEQGPVPRFRRRRLPDQAVRSARRLVAQIQAIVRRSKGHAHSEIRTGKLAVNLAARTVSVEDRPLPDRQGVRHPGVVEPPQGDDSNEGNVPQPSLRRSRRAGAEDRRRLHLQVAQEAGNGYSRRSLHRDCLGPRLCSARSGPPAAPPTAQAA